MVGSDQPASTKGSGGTIKNRIAVTGGLGFIGSAFIRNIQSPKTEILNIDLDTYAGDERRLQDSSVDRVRTERMDICSSELLRVFEHFRPDLVVHFAAESHVTRSEFAADRFHHTNVAGTRNVLEASRHAGTSLVVHVSTDEVYGPCPGDPFVEGDKLPGEGLATSAYARSKALADDLARSWTGTDVIVVRPTNCFGPWQHPEKAIARWATRALSGNRIPVWGDGQQVRDWMYVEDACRGIQTVIERGKPREVYNLGPQQPQRTNMEVARIVAAEAGATEGVYLTDYDRPNHDRRYAIDASKVVHLGWSPTSSLEHRLATTVSWYRNNRSWWTSLLGQAESIYDDALERR
jgi:dTDP-glucose 4,6-dehydratase